jgi:Cu(I)/Ag(I) efflux system membrane fusion protein
LGVPPTQIDALERSGKAHPRIGLFAPTDGVVLVIGAKEGGQVNPGINLFTLVDLSGVWLHAQVPEDQLFRVAPGARVEARLKALPGQLFEGRVDYIYPDVDTATRTVRVRSVLRNPGQRLRPGMVADVSIAGGDKRSLLLVPSEAVIYTGKRNVVIVTDGPGQFRAVEVKTGQEAQGKTEVTAGLSAGQRVVVSGQFLIESEASLSSALVRLQSTGVQAPESLHAGHDAGGSIKAPESGHAGHGASGVVGPNPASATHQGEGTVESIDVGASKVVLAHGPIKTLDWPPMTMGFAVPDQKLLGSLNAGDVVRFSFREDAAGDYVIIAIEPKGGGRRTP